jgi:hypothetical protein
MYIVHTGSDRTKNSTSTVNEDTIENRVSDPDPDWIRIQSGQWIRIQKGKNDPQK